MSIRVSAAKPRTICVRASSGASATARSAASRDPPELAEHLLQLGKARPGERVLRVALDRLAQRRARFLELEVRLQRVGQGDPRRAGVRAQLHRAPRIGQRLRLAVLHHLDDRALGQRLAGIRVQRERPLDRHCRLVHPADVQEHAGPVGIVARIARRLGHGLERGQRAGVVVGGHSLDRRLQSGRQGAGGAPPPASSARIGG